MSSGETFKSKLYRYCFFGWMLEQPPGDVYGRNAARTRNREALDRWLPHYIRVHATLAALCCFALLCAIDFDLGDCCVALCALADAAEVCLTIGMVSAYVALRLQALTGDIDND